MPRILLQQGTNLVNKFALLLHKCQFAQDSRDKPENDGGWRCWLSICCKLFNYPSPADKSATSPARGEVLNNITFKGLDVVRQYAALFERRVQSSTRVRKAQAVTRQTKHIRNLLPQCASDATGFLSDVYKKSTRARKFLADGVQFGRSMIEMLGVLAIIAVLSVGGIAGYGKAMEKFKLTKALDDYSMLINGLIEYKDNIRKIKTNDSLYGLVNIVQSLNLVPKTWKKVSAMHISDNYGNVLRIYSNNMDSENVFYVIDFYLGGTKISDKGSEVSPDFSSKLCLNLMTNLIVPLETAISSVNIWHTPDTSHAIGISKSKFYDLNYLHYACNSCGQDEACAISVIFKY